MALMVPMVLMGYVLLIPMMYMVMNMMISYTTVKDEPTDYYMLCDRVGDLEVELRSLMKRKQDEVGDN